MLLVFGASGNTIGYAVDYMQVYAIGTVFVQLTLGLNAFISAQGFRKTSMFTGANRGSVQYHTGSGVYLCLWHGRSGSGAGDHYIAVYLHDMDAAVFDEQAHNNTSQKRKIWGCRQRSYSVSRAGIGAVYYAVYGKSAGGML